MTDQDVNRKSKRQVCWAARDEMIQCLRKNPDASYENCPPCEAIKKKFHEDCPESWVKHFVKKWKFEKVKNLMLLPNLADNIEDGK